MSCNEEMAKMANTSTVAPVQPWCSNQLLKGSDATMTRSIPQDILSAMAGTASPEQQRRLAAAAASATMTSTDHRSSFSLLPTSQPQLTSTGFLPPLMGLSTLASSMATDTTPSSFPVDRLSFLADSEAALRQERLLSMLTRQQQLQELSSAAGRQPQSSLLLRRHLQSSTHPQQQQHAATDALLGGYGLAAASALHQEQQQQLAWMTQQRQKRAQLYAAHSSALSSGIFGSLTGVNTAPATSAGPASFTADRLQKMLAEQQQLIWSLEQEVAMANATSAAGHVIGGSDCDDTSNRSAGSRRPIAEICFPQNTTTSTSHRTSGASEEVAASAIMALQGLTGRVGDFGCETAATGMPVTVAVPSGPVGLNPRRVVSESSIATGHMLQASQPTSQAPNVIMAQKPKRPLSAYNLFFKDERARMMLADGEDDMTSDGQKVVEKADGSGTVVTEGSGRKRKKAANGGIKESEEKRKKIGFAVLAQSIGAKWKSMDEENIQKYKDLASQEKKRYQTELVAYKAHQELEWQKNQKELEATVDKETRERYFANR